MRKMLTPKTISALKAAEKGSRYEVMDTVVPHLGVRVSSKGSRTFIVFARFPGNPNPVRRTLADADIMDLATARETARDWLMAIAKGQDPRQEQVREVTLPLMPEPTIALPPLIGEAPCDNEPTVQSVVSLFLKRHVRKESDTAEGAGPKRKKEAPLRSAIEIERIFDRYILADFEGKPRWRDRAFISIRRADVTRLMDVLEDDHGPGQADHVLAMLSKLFNWYAARSDDYVSPIVRGMRRSSVRLRVRKRILNDEEIRVLWVAAQSTGTFGAFARVALLTGQRRSKLLTMKWTDISETGVWAIRTEAREKGNAASLQLPKTVIDVIKTQPRRNDNVYVFASRYDGPFNSLSKGKAALEEKMAASLGHPTPHWVVHDLRRTAKSLMARARVPRDISERVLGHVIPGVEGVYDHYSYFDEKAQALKKLSALVLQIVADDKPQCASKAQARPKATADKRRDQSSSD
ncbi:tyrosine-type recombinase/integrase [Sphingobium subterraneum]|nr:integrase family protein [Sphingobium subterraneum]